MRDLSRPRSRIWPARFWLLIILGGLMAVTSLILIVVVTTNAEAARSWPSTTGRIEVVSVRTVHARYHDAYEPHVEYSYAVAGHAYRSAQISWGGRGDFSRFEDASDYLASHFVPGRAVQVFYAPDDPTNAILSQDNYYLAPFLMLPFGILLAGAGWLGRRRAKRRS